MLIIRRIGEPSKEPQQTAKTLRRKGISGQQTEGLQAGPIEYGYVRLAAAKSDPRLPRQV